MSPKSCNGKDCNYSIKPEELALKRFEEEEEPEKLALKRFRENKESQ